MKTSLNLGCGNDYKESDSETKWINIDIGGKCNLILDVEHEPLPYEDNSIDYIEASHLIEHLDGIIPLMNECNRVLKPGCEMCIVTPQPTTPYFWQDPTHKRGYVANTFSYYFQKNPWNIISYNIKFWSKVEVGVVNQTINSLPAEILVVKIYK